MTINIPNLALNWHTTVQSILSVTLAVTGYLMVSSTISPHTAMIMGTMNGLAKVILGVFQSDATPSQPAK